MILDHLGRKANLLKAKDKILNTYKTGLKNVNKTVTHHDSSNDSDIVRITCFIACFLRHLFLLLLVSFHWWGVAFLHAAAPEIMLSIYIILIIWYGIEFWFGWVGRGVEIFRNKYVADVFQSVFELMEYATALFSVLHVVFLLPYSPSLLSHIPRMTWHNLVHTFESILAICVSVWDSIMSIHKRKEVERMSGSSLEEGEQFEEK